MTEYSEFKGCLVADGGNPSVLAYCAADRRLLQTTPVGRSLLQRNNGNGFSGQFLKELRKDAAKFQLTKSKHSREVCFSPKKKDACRGLLARLSSVTVPFQPFLLQTAAGNGNFNGCFCAFRDAEDAIVFLQAVQEQGWMKCGDRLVECSTYFEVPFVEPDEEGAGTRSILTSLMLDYEILYSAFSDGETQRATHEEARAITSSFPEFLYQRMIEERIVERSTLIIMDVKNKCRDIFDKTGRKIDDKYSYHVNVYIYGRPAYEHRLACLKMFGKFAKEMDAFKRNNKKIPTKMDASAAQYLGLDTATWHGGQPMSTLGSNKKTGDQPCFLQHRIHFCNGCEIKREAFQPLSQCTPEEYLAQLSTACFTNPKICANYSPHFLQHCERQILQGSIKGPVNRTLADGHQTPSQGSARGHPPFDEKALPEWLQESAEKPVSVNCKLPCLSAYSATLQSLLPHSPSLVTCRVQNIVCPSQLFGCGVVRVHSSNGVFIAVDKKDPSTIYAKCSTCTLPTPLKEETPVHSPSANPTFGWIQVEESKFKALLRQYRGSCGSRAKKIKVS